MTRPLSTCGLSVPLSPSSSRPFTITALWLMTLTMMTRTPMNGATPQSRIFLTNCRGHGRVLSGNAIRCSMAHAATSALRGAFFAPVDRPRQRTGLSVFSSIRPVVDTYLMLDQTFTELPDANKINFIDSPGVHLSTLLPHFKGPRLYEKQAHFPPADPEPTALDLIHRLLVYPPDSRFRAADALKHPWLLGDAPLVLPQVALASDSVPACAAEVRDGRTAGEWLRVFLTPSPRSRSKAVDD